MESHVALAWVLGPMELVLLLVVALIIFGPRRLPEIGEATGKAINSFRVASAGGGAQPASGAAQPTPPAAPAPPVETSETAV